MPGLKVKQVRSTHPYSFRSGEWATIVREDKREDGKDTWLVQFPDGVTDVWLQFDSPARYEFRWS